MDVSVIEEAPLWDRVTHPFASALEFALGCHHRHLSRVFTLRGRSYKVCCDCGQTFDYSLLTMSTVQSHRRLSAILGLCTLRRLRTRHP